MYILLFKPIIRKNIPMLFKWVTMLFTWSKYNHMAIFYKGMVYEMKGHGFQDIDLKKCLKESASIIHAYKFIREFDENKLAKRIKWMYSAKYDALGAMESEGEILGKAIQKFIKNPDNKVFCNEFITLIMQDNHYLPKAFDSNRYSPQELLNKLFQLNLIEKNYEVWK